MRILAIATLYGFLTSKLVPKLHTRCCETCSCPPFHGVDGDEKAETMTELFDRPIVLLAWTVAMVLLFFGVRRFTSGADRRSGLFKTALSFFLIMNGAAIGTGCTSRAANSGNPSGAPTDSQVSTAPVVDAAQVRATKVAAVSDVQIPEDLAADGRWIRFESFWKRLDSVEPKQRPNRGEAGTPSFDHGYTNALTTEEQQALRVELAEILGRGVDDLHRLTATSTYRPVDSGSGRLAPLTEILVRLALRRIEHMGFDHHLMTRMMPPPSVSFQGVLVDEMEHRIDSLLKLRARRVLDEEAFGAGLQKLQDDVYLFSVLSVMDHRFGYLTPVPENSSAKARISRWRDENGARTPLWYDPAAWIRGFEQAHRQREEAQSQSQAGPSKTSAAVSESYRAVKARLAELERLEPRLDALIRELER